MGVSRFADRIRSDLIYARGFLGTLPKVTGLAKTPDQTIVDRVIAWGAARGDTPALVSDLQSLSYAGLSARAGQYARWVRGLGLGKGDVVALMQPNSPEYMAAWIGVASTGASCALINTHLAGTPLAHALNIVPADHLLIDTRYLPTLEAIRGDLTRSLTLWTAGGVHDGLANTDATLDAIPATPLGADERADLHIEDPALYIYTSGTTGLPKAAVINHYRVQAAMIGFSGLSGAKPSDRIYIAQPMYHTTGGVLAPGIALEAGGAAVVREEFSASAFWDDIVRHDCTMFQYIGELCRYLLNAPITANETRHRIRLCNGNGLRPDIWPAFQERFHIPRIFEWYAATEGNVTLFNLDGKVGSIGRIPPWIAHKFPIKLARHALGSGDLERDAQGRLIECGADEIGEAIGLITNDPQKPAGRFDGYADREATSRKIITDGFEEGDRWFRTGDLLKRDADGYYYFVDRIGDTFRWKGENVSTTEVEHVLTGFPGIEAASVYGVDLPGHDGRAGMAALVCDGELDLEGFHRHVTDNLASYARPVVLRLKPELDRTGTFKLKKVDLKSDGCDPEQSVDPLYFDDRATGTYRPLDPDLWQRLNRGEIRL
ncbi:MAG: long-chain-acyl-CoA synthetase [Pseudomonadota bacterium]